MGILLLILFILIVSILCILLFVPIRWESGAKAARLPVSSFRAFGNVRWLAGAVCFQIRANEDKIALRLKLFGRVIRQTAFRWRYPFAEENEPERQNRKEPEQEPVRKSSRDAETAPGHVKPPKSKPENLEGSSSGKKPEAGKDPQPKAKSKTDTKTGKAPDPEKTAAKRTAGAAIEKKRAKEETGTERIKALWATAHEPENARMLALVKQQVNRILRHLRPQTARVHAVVGLSDPAATGKLLGTFYAFRPFFAQAGDLRLMGDFEQKTLEGKLYLKGRVRLAVPVSAALRLYLDKGIRRLVNSYFKH